jgi:uncharacterized protein YndB with AHSA1/START domain
MQTKTIKKSVHINAPGEKVWKVLTDDQLTRAWYALFSEGIYADTDWKEGSKAVFMDKTHNGLISRVTSSKPNEVLAIEYTGIVTDGSEDYNSDLANAVKGGKEIYRLSHQNGHTDLSVECDLSEQMYDEMNRTWDKAIVKIRELAESR